MSIKKINLQEFVELAKRHPTLDVRSPGEFNHAHIPGAYSLPLFSDEERKIVGTAYKQQGKQVAIKFGLGFFGVKMKEMIDEVEKIIKNHEFGMQGSGIVNAPILVHCWRGGMRSAGVAWLLDLYGFDVYTLAGGYKAYRNWVLAQFEKEYNIVIIGGYTGSGKTGLLKEMQKKGQATIDLEGLANHKGSAFGDMGKQPTQEMFENLLSEQLQHGETCGKTIWIEDESQRIGLMNIPNNFWKTMRTKPVSFLEIPFEERLHFITVEYGSIEKEKLVNAIIRIQKRLGPLETKTAIGFLMENNYTGCFEILLKYYDKSYGKSLQKRENLHSLLTKISCPTVEPISNTDKLLSCATLNV